ncbi:hypothetical protein VTK73DRAFT_2703 [Phialemonium thermophilum]|uniref:DNase1 protein n=1 Tax=Phialemonium thermophilum TaxID=223376 RepID=A0ABR3X3T6_9PEZI
MQFTLASLLAAAALASANSITFVSQDNTDRTVYFTSNPGSEELPSVTVPAGSTQKVEFPYGWAGNYYSVSAGADNVPGMLGEVNFNAWGDLNFFDVSAIVNPADHDGVQEIYPAGSKQPVSGCGLFPCNNAYYNPDDVQTKSTTEPDLITTLGRASDLDSRDLHKADEMPTFKRDFVVKKWVN